MPKIQPACRISHLHLVKDDDHHEELSVVSESTGSTSLAAPALPATNLTIEDLLRLNPALARFAGSGATSLPVSQIEHLGALWLEDCKRRRFSKRTLEFRQDVLKKLLWWLERTGAERLDKTSIAAFLDYINRGHLELGGRWGNAHSTKPVTPETAHRWYRELKSWMNFLEAEEHIAASPMQKMRAPRVPEKELGIFSPVQAQALLAAARASQHPLRDTAILHFYLDTGVRAEEGLQIHIAHLNIDELTAYIANGKGGKDRTVSFGFETKKVLWAYLKKERCALDRKIKPSRKERTMQRLLASAQSPFLFVGDRGALWPAAHPSRPAIFVPAVR